MCCVVFTGVCYTVWQMGMVATSTLYAQEYSLSELKIGLTYISNGTGSLCGSLLTGRILDRDCRLQLAREIAGKGGVEPGGQAERIERARILSLRFPTECFILCVMGFGWAIQLHAHIAVSIILAFFIGGFDTYILATFCKSSCISSPVPKKLSPQCSPILTDTSRLTATLVVDLFEADAFSATACVNLSRCLLAAAGTSAIEPLILCHWYRLGIYLPCFVVPWLLWVCTGRIPLRASLAENTTAQSLIALQMK